MFEFCDETLKKKLMPERCLLNSVDEYLKSRLIGKVYKLFIYNPKVYIRQIQYTISLYDTYYLYIFSLFS